MLTLKLGSSKGVVYATSRFFDAVKEDDWLKDDFVKEMIKDVDNSEVLGNNVIKSPILGLISPQMLSGGVKTLILIYFMPEYIFNGSQLGDNCLKSLLKMCNIIDRTVWIGHLYNFNYNTKYNPEDEWFNINLIDDDNNSKIVKSMKEFITWSYNKIEEPLCNEEEYNNTEDSEMEALYKEKEEFDKTLNNEYIEVKYN